MMNRPNAIHEKLLPAAAALCMAAGLATAQQVKVVEKVVDGGDCEIECEVVCEGEGENIVIEKILLSDATPAANVILTSQPEVKTESHITMVQKTDDREVKVEIKVQVQVQV